MLARESIWASHTVMSNCSEGQPPGKKRGGIDGLISIVRRYRSEKNKLYLIPVAVLGISISIHI